MMKLLLLLSVIFVADAFVAREKCDYTHDTRMYVCKYVSKIFPKIFYGNYNLKCVDCNIKIFGKETFPFENNLISMNLSASGIQNISKNAFSSLTTLQHIDLRSNDIWNVSEDAFYALRQVYELHLEHNKLTELTPKFLNGFEANSIALSYNKLTEIQDNIFDGIFGAMSLDLSHNKIHTLHTESFNHLHGLEYLNLEANDLCNIPLGTFKHLGPLKELNLSGNRFKKFNYGTFSGLPALVSLNLSGNALIEFDATVLLPLTGITGLDISANGLNYLDGISVHSNAPGLRRLAISDNLWICSSLTNLLRYLRTVFIEIIEHDKYDVTNLHGIACIEKHITDAKIPFDTFYKIAKEFTAGAYAYC